MKTRLINSSNNLKANTDIIPYSAGKVNTNGNAGRINKGNVHCNAIKLHNIIIMELEGCYCCRCLVFFSIHNLT